MRFRLDLLEWDVIDKWQKIEWLESDPRKNRKEIYMLYNDLGLYRDHFVESIFDKLPGLKFPEAHLEDFTNKARGLRRFFVTIDDAVVEIGGWDQVKTYLEEHQHNCRKQSDFSCDLRLSENCSEGSGRLSSNTLTSNGSEFVDTRNSIYGKSFIGVSQEEANRFRQNFVVYDQDLESQLKNNRAKDIYDQLQDLVQLQGDIGEIIVGAKDKIGQAEANIDKADKEITLANQELRKALSYESDRKYRKIKAGSTAIGGAIGIIGGPIGIGIGLGAGWLLGKIINTAGKKKEAQQLAYLDENLKIANGED